MAVRHATVKSTEVAHSEGTFNSTFKIGTNVTIGQGTYNDATGEVDFLNANIKTTGNVSGASHQQGLGVDMQNKLLNGMKTLLYGNILCLMKV